MFATRAYQAALNALLAEHSLGLIELVPQNPFAEKLKNAIILAFRKGDRSRFDEGYWVNSFNHADRLVQLNFVAMGLNELGHSPMLPGEFWMPVRNPWVNESIESKLLKASRHLQRRHQLEVQIRHGRRLTLLSWGVADETMEDAPGGEEKTSRPSVEFMGGMPHPEQDKAKTAVTIGEFKVLYYEHPHTIGKIAGIQPIFEYPQLAVVYRQDYPVCIIRVEKGMFGTCMLGKLDAAGNHTNLGTFEPTTSSKFLDKVRNLLDEMPNRTRSSGGTPQQGSRGNTSPTNRGTKGTNVLSDLDEIGLSRRLANLDLSKGVLGDVHSLNENLGLSDHSVEDLSKSTQTEPLTVLLALLYAVASIQSAVTVPSKTRRALQEAWRAQAPDAQVVAQLAKVLRMRVGWEEASEWLQSRYE